VKTKDNCRTNQTHWTRCRPNER